MRKPRFNVPHLLAIIGIIGSAVLIALLVAALFAAPIADDFFYFSHPDITHPARYTIDFYLTNTGRYGQAAAVSVLYSIFGNNAVIVGPVFEIAAIFFLLLWIVHLITRIFRINLSMPAKIVVSTLTSGLMLTASTSIFDSLYWLTSSTVYVMSLVWMLLSLALSLSIYSLRSRRWWHYAVLAVVVFIGQSFSEPTSAIVIATAGLALTISWLKKNYHTARLSLTVFASSTLGFLFLYLSPGSQHRQAATGSGLHLQEMFLGALPRLKVLFSDFIGWRGLLAIALGLTFVYLLPKLHTRARRIVFLAGALLLVAPLYITEVIAIYAMGDYMPFRAHTVPLALSALGIALLTYGIVSWSKYAKRYSHLAGLAAILLLVVGATFASRQLITITKAEALRLSQLSVRSALATQQQSANTVYLNPAPILLEKTEAIDINFGTKQTDWFIDGMHRYYGLKPDANIIPVSSQPVGYCMTKQAPLWYGAGSCDALAHDVYSRLLNK